MLHRYFLKTPWWARTLFPSYVWRIPSAEKIVYLTFDDGPHPTITPWVLAELKKYEAKATFFCIGANVLRFPQAFQQILGVENDDSALFGRGGVGGKNHSHKFVPAALWQNKKGTGNRLERGHENGRV